MCTGNESPLPKTNNSQNQNTTHQNTTGKTKRKRKIYVNDDIQTPIKNDDTTNKNKKLNTIKKDLSTNKNIDIPPTEDKIIDCSKTIQYDINNMPFRIHGNTNWSGFKNTIPIFFKKYDYLPIQQFDIYRTFAKIMHDCDLKILESFISSLFKFDGIYTIKMEKLNPMIQTRKGVNVFYKLCVELYERLIKPLLQLFDMPFRGPLELMIANSININSQEFIENEGWHFAGDPNIEGYIILIPLEPVTIYIVEEGCKMWYEWLLDKKFPIILDDTKIYKYHHKQFTPLILKQNTIIYYITKPNKGEYTFLLRISTVNDRNGHSILKKLHFKDYAEYLQGNDCFISSTFFNVSIRNIEFNFVDNFLRSFTFGMLDEDYQVEKGMIKKYLQEKSTSSINNITITDVVLREGNMINDEAYDTLIEYKNSNIKGICKEEKSQINNIEADIEINKPYTTDMFVELFNYINGCSNDISINLFVNEKGRKELHKKFASNKIKEAYEYIKNNNTDILAKCQKLLLDDDYKNFIQCNYEEHYIIRHIFLW